MENRDKRLDALPEELKGLVADRDLSQAEDAFFNYVYNELSALGQLTEDEIDNMMAYLHCIAILRSDSPDFFYDMKADYRVTWEKLTGEAWEKTNKEDD